MKRLLKLHFTATQTSPEHYWRWGLIHTQNTKKHYEKQHPPDTTRRREF